MHVVLSKKKQCEIGSVSLLGHISLQSLSMKFLSQEYWTGEPFPFLRNLPDPVLLHCK